MTVNIKCGDPGHPGNSNQPGWNDGTLATADRAITGIICPGCAAYNIANPPATSVNQQTLQQRAMQALVNNAAFIAAPKPGTASGQASAAYDQAVALTRECSALIRLMFDAVDSTAGT